MTDEKECPFNWSGNTWKNRALGSGLKDLGQPGNNQKLNGCGSSQFRRVRGRPFGPYKVQVNCLHIATDFIPGPRGWNDFTAASTIFAFYHHLPLMNFARKPGLRDGIRALNELIQITPAPYAKATIGISLQIVEVRDWGRISVTDKLLISFTYLIGHWRKWSSYIHMMANEIDDWYRDHWGPIKIWNDLGNGS